MERKHKPAWWLLYLTVPLLIVLLIGEGRLSECARGNTAFWKWPSSLVVFGLMAVWVRANEAALMDEDYGKIHWTLERDPSGESDRDPRELPLADVLEDSEQDGSRWKPTQRRKVQLICSLNSDPRSCHSWLLTVITGILYHLP